MPSFIRDHRVLLWGGLLLCAGLALAGFLGVLLIMINILY